MWEVPVFRLFSTSNSWTLTLARVALGGVMIPHGLQKTVGWLGGYGWTGTMGYFTDQVGLPAPIAATVILAESLFAVLLVMGALSRVSALLIAAVMVGAVVTDHGQHGFFMNWTGQAAGEGFEYHVLAVALASITMIGGGGALSVDGVVARRATDTAARPALARG